MLLADEIDFVFTHIHPLWNGKQLEDGIEWMDSVYQELQSMHSDKPIVIGETGWATDYDSTITGEGQQGTLIKGVVSVQAQATFLIEMHTWIESNKVVSFLFEVFDESWKGGGENSSYRHIEKHWGVFNEDRTPKKSFVKYVETFKK